MVKKALPALTMNQCLLRVKYKQGEFPCILFCLAAKQARSLQQQQQLGFNLVCSSIIQYTVAGITNDLPPHPPLFYHVYSVIVKGDQHITV